MCLQLKHHIHSHNIKLKTTITSILYYEDFLCTSLHSLPFIHWLSCRHFKSHLEGIYGTAVVMEHGDHHSLLLFSIGDGQRPLSPCNPSLRGIDGRRGSLGLAVAAASSDILRLHITMALP